MGYMQMARHPTTGGMETLTAVAVRNGRFSTWETTPDTVGLYGAFLADGGVANVTPVSDGVGAVAMDERDGHGRGARDGKATFPVFEAVSDAKGGSGHGPVIGWGDAQKKRTLALWDTATDRIRNSIAVTHGERNWHE